VADTFICLLPTPDGLCCNCGDEGILLRGEQPVRNAKALTDEALRVKVVSACPESGSHSHDQRGITYGCDLCPTIATLLGFGFNVATAERLDGFDGLGDCYYEGWNDHMDVLRTIEVAP